MQSLIGYYWIFWTLLLVNLKKWTCLNCCIYWTTFVILIKFAGCVAWVLICKLCKFGEKICNNSRDIEFFLGDYYFSACPVYGSQPIEPTTCTPCIRMSWLLPVDPWPYRRHLLPTSVGLNSRRLGTWLRRRGIASNHQRLTKLRGWTSVGPQYNYILLTLISRTPLRYIRNVAHEE